VRESLFQVFKIVVRVVIPFASLATGLRAATVDPFWLFKRPSLLWRSLLAILVLVPLGTFLFLEAIHASGLVESGLLVAILAVGIGPPAVFKRTCAADANIAYEVELNVVLLALTIFFIPTALALLGAYFRIELRLEPSRVAVLVLTRALIPLLAGVLVARLLPKVALPVGRIAGPIVQFVLLAVVAVALLATWRGLFALGARAWLTCAAVALGAVAIGHLCGGRDAGQRRVLANFSTLRFPGLALLVASAAPLGKRVVPVVLAYVISGVVCLAIYDALTRGRKARVDRGVPAGAVPRRA
jgi:BASS family bile acid:Na+ symporter